MWVSFDVYRLFRKPANPSVPAIVSAPLVPTLDQDAINQIEARTFFDDSQVPEITVQESQPSIPEPMAVPSASPIPAPENASGSGTST